MKNSVHLSCIISKGDDFVKRLLCVIPLVTVLLTGCSAETDNVLIETTAYMETVTATEKVTTAETTVTEAAATAKTTSEFTTTTVSETELPIAANEVIDTFIGFPLYSNALTLKEQQLLAGSKEALGLCKYFLGMDECLKLTEWAENIDLDKNVVAMRVFTNCCSSDKFTINDIYAENGEIVFDYDYERPETHTEDIICYVIAGVIPKSDLAFLENDDEWGITLSAEYDPNTHTVSGSFFQWGEKDITELMSGSWYEIERYNEEKGWCRLEYAQEFEGQEICWTSEGWIIPEYGQRTFEQELFLYDKLKTGKYRIAKSIFDLPDPENSRTYYAEFEVE